ncbi:hypothetical protein [Streptomyces sp. NPDC091209]|uniref:hypothetical protein n=1 Tax=Streptomyces sp. NPDC091209 TaxID=3365974 RepID=UPI0037FB6D5D
MSTTSNCHPSTRHLHRCLVFAITAFGLCAVGGVLLGDALTLRPQEAVRTASLAPRLIRDQVPPRMAPCFCCRRPPSSACC